MDAVYEYVQAVYSPIEKGIIFVGESRVSFELLKQW